MTTNAAQNQATEPTITGAAAGDQAIGKGAESPGANADRRNAPVLEYGPAMLVHRPTWDATWEPVIGDGSSSSGKSTSGGRTARAVTAAGGRHVLAEIALADERHVGPAFDAAEAALKNQAWSDMTCADRAELLTRISELIRDHAEELVAAFAEETGRPVRLVREDDLPLTEFALREHAKWAARPDAAALGAALTDADGRLSSPAAVPDVSSLQSLVSDTAATRGRPAGVAVIAVDEPVGALPLIMLWLAPALGAGNTVILVPPPEATLSILRLVRIMSTQIGLPAGVINVLPIDRRPAERSLRGGPRDTVGNYEQKQATGKDLSDDLSDDRSGDRRGEVQSSAVHPVLDALARSGRADVYAWGGPQSIADHLLIACMGETEIHGSDVVNTSSATTIAGRRTKFMCRLTGFHAIAVFEDGPADEAIEIVARAAFMNHGHPLAGIGRLYIQESILNSFLTRLKWRMGSLQVGDPLDENTDVGPLAVADHHVEAIEHLRRAHFEGVAINTGGSSAARPWPPTATGEMQNEGAWLKPSLLTAIGPSHAAARDPIAGPVLPVLSFRTGSEAIARLNNTPYHFGVGLFAHQLSMLQMMSERVETTLRWWNIFGVIDPARPTLLARSFEGRDAPLGSAAAFAAFMRGPE